eukprot:s758_g1.t2
MAGSSNMSTETWHYALFACNCCLWLTVGLNNSSVAWTLKDLAESLGLDHRQESLVASGFAMGYCLGPVAMGLLLDRLGRRPTLLICCLVPSLCQAATSMLPDILAATTGTSADPWVAAAGCSFLRLCQGCCSGGATMSSKVYLNEMLPAASRNAMMSIIHTQLQLGGVALTLLALFWPRWQELHRALGVQGFVTFLLLLCPALLPESSEFLAQKREPRKDDVPRDRGGSELLSLPLRKLTVVLVANQFLHRLGQQGNDAWGIKFLQVSGRGHARSMVSNVKFACKILGGLLAASSARYGIYAALVGGYMTCSVGTLLFISATDSVSLTIAWGVAYLGEEVANVLSMKLGSHPTPGFEFRDHFPGFGDHRSSSLPSRLRGRGVSLVSAPNALAGFLAGALGALSAYSLRAPFMVTAASMLTSGTVLLAFSGFIQQQSLEHRSDLKGKED